MFLQTWQFLHTIVAAFAVLQYVHFWKLWMQYNAMQYNTMKCNTIECNAMQYNTIECNATQCNAMQSMQMQCNAMQYNTMECNKLYLKYWKLVSSEKYFTG